MIRVLDITIAALGILFLLPLMLIIYLLGLRDSPRPIFVQKRLGKNKKLFSLLKFRTMTEQTASVGTHEVNPNAITSMGHTLRKYKIDELPQLFNVLLGHMSLVGPRPCLPNQQDVIDARDEKNVFQVRPGITGFAQLREIDMSTPGKLAVSDKELIDSLNIKSYINCIILTVIGGGRGDRINK